MGDERHQKEDRTSVELRDRGHLPPEKQCPHPHRPPCPASRPGIQAEATGFLPKWWCMGVLLSSSPQVWKVIPSHGPTGKVCHRPQARVRKPPPQSRLTQQLHSHWNERQENQGQAQPHGSAFILFFQ